MIYLRVKRTIAFAFRQSLAESKLPVPAADFNLQIIHSQKPATGKGQ